MLPALALSTAITGIFIVAIPVVCQIVTFGFNLFGG